MKLKIYFISFFFILATNTEAKNVALTIGGGCDATLSTEMAKETAKMHDSMTKRGWESSIVFGDDKEDLERVRSHTSSSHLQSKSFTKAALISELDRIAGSVSKNDQFLMNIVTHGAPGKELADKDHFICMGNGQKISVNDPDFQAGIKRIHDKGVKIAVLDDSCYGGGSIDAFKDYGCVLSTQSSELVSTAIYDWYDPNTTFGVTSILRDLMDRPEASSFNLEDLYIETLDNYSGRLEIGLPVFPQISTDPKGNALSDDLAYLIGEDDKLAPYSSFNLKYEDTELKSLSSDELQLVFADLDKMKQYICKRQIEASKDLDVFLEDGLNIAEKMRMRYRKRAKNVGDIEIKLDELDYWFDDLAYYKSEIELVRKEIAAKEKLLQEKSQAYQDDLKKLEEKHLSAISMPLEILGIDSNTLKEKIANSEFNEFYQGCKISEKMLTCDGAFKEKDRHKLPGQYLESGFNIGVLGDSPGAWESYLGSGFNIDKEKLRQFQKETKEQISNQMKASSEGEIFSQTAGEVFELEQSIPRLKERQRKNTGEFAIYFNKIRPYDYAFRRNFKKPSVCRDFKI